VPPGKAKTGNTKFDLVVTGGPLAIAITARIADENIGHATVLAGLSLASKYGQR
jgi:hypothetical protein